MEEIAQEMAQNFSGPVIFHYVWWVLREARKRGIKQLYFLARDGYTLHKIAGLFCRQFDLKIKCSYLYCSRMALRMPAYFFIGDEAFDLLFLRGYRVTLKSLLQRGGLTAEERRAVYEECGLSDFDEDQILSRGALEQCVSKIKEGRTFRSCVTKRSRAAYTNAIGYFKAEGLLELDQIAIVDSGWTGSMQRSLRQLLEFYGYTGTITGFYFGMYAKPKARVDGEYVTWYFNASSMAKEKARFCNNLFECLLSAPHGMTVGYREANGAYEPVLLPPPAGQELALISAQSDLICGYAVERLTQIAFDHMDIEAMRKDTALRVKRYMFTPTMEEASYYGKFLFCDDVTEAYYQTLADNGQINLLKNYSIVRRVAHRLAKHSVRDAGTAELFWPCGTIAFLPSKKRWWNRVNVYAWEWLKHQYAALKVTGVENEVDIDVYKKKMERYDVVSFDIFDTLLYRVVNKPTDVFYLMEPWAEEHFGIQDFGIKRITAEKEARDLTKSEEITLDDIYRVLHAGRETADKLKEKECKTEIMVLRRDNKMAELLSYAIEMGKKVLIISDMYQSKEFLQMAFKKVGINNYDVLYVSSEEKKTKAAGSLFAEVAEREKIDKKKWLHIGDNYHSDYAVPKKVGISAALYNNGRKPNESKISGIRILTEKVKLFYKMRRISDVSTC